MSGERIPLAVVAFTGCGAKLALEIKESLEATGRYACAVCAPAKYAVGAVGVLQVSVTAFAGEAFRAGRGLIFVSAAGIAVRAIAPHLRDKLTDPPVLAVDETGEFVIPLVSGHVGGANALARELAKLIGATAVITTATDRNERFAVDVWAAAQGLCIGERERAKEVSAALLAGETVGFCSDFVTEGDLPAGLVMAEAGALGISVSLAGTEQIFTRTLHLTPRIVTLGVGCRKGVEPAVFERAVLAMLSENELSPHALRAVATIDRKAQEPCIRAFCENYRLPLLTASAEVLAAMEGQFTGSAFVARTVGVDNVCERAAVLISGGTLLLRKRSCDAVTVAAAAEDFRVCFTPPDREETI